MGVPTISGKGSWSANSVRRLKAAGNSMFYGLYAGDIDWQVETAAMAKVSYG
jgi:hypothetical protein